MACQGRGWGWDDGLGQGSGQGLGAAHFQAPPRGVPTFTVSLSFFTRPPSLASAAWPRRAMRSSNPLNDAPEIVQIAEAARSDAATLQPGLAALQAEAPHLLQRILANQPAFLALINGGRATAVASEDRGAEALDARLNAAAVGQAPFDALWSIAKALRDSGMGQHTLYELFDRHQLARRDDDDETAYNALLDVMDFVVGYHSPGHAGQLYQRPLAAVGAARGSPSASAAAGAAWPHPASATEAQPPVLTGAPVPVVTEASLTPATAPATAPMTEAPAHSAEVDPALPRLDLTLTLTQPNPNPRPAA